MLSDIARLSIYLVLHFLSSSLVLAKGIYAKNSYGTFRAGLDLLDCAALFSAVLVAYLATIFPDSNTSHNLYQTHTDTQIQSSSDFPHGHPQSHSYSHSHTHTQQSLAHRHGQNAHTHTHNDDRDDLRIRITNNPTDNRSTHRITASTSADFPVDMPDSNPHQLRFSEHSKFHGKLLVYTYGRNRFYVLSSFSITIVIILDSLLHMLSAVNGLLSDASWLSILSSSLDEDGHQKDKTLENLLESSFLRDFHATRDVAFIQFVICCIGLFLFRGARSVKVRRPKDDTMEAVFLHAAAEGMEAASGAVVSLIFPDSREFSSVYGLLLTLTASIVSIQLTLPLIQSTSTSLLQGCNLDIHSAVNYRLRRAAVVNGVEECFDAHFWPQAAGIYVGTLRVRIREDANEQVVLASILDLFDDFLDDLTVEIERSSSIEKETKDP